MTNPHIDQLQFMASTKPESLMMMTPDIATALKWAIPILQAIDRGSLAALTATCNSDAVTAQACVKERRKMHATLAHIREALGVPADASETEILKRIRTLEQEGSRRAWPDLTGRITEARAILQAKDGESLKDAASRTMASWLNAMPMTREILGARDTEPVQEAAARVMGELWIAQQRATSIRKVAHGLLEALRLPGEKFPPSSEIAIKRIKSMTVAATDHWSELLDILGAKDGETIGEAAHRVMRDLRTAKEASTRLLALSESLQRDIDETMEILGTTEEETMGESARRVISELDAARANTSAARMVEIRRTLKTWLAVETKEAERPRSRTMIGRAIDALTLRLATERALTLYRVLGLFPDTQP